MELSNNEILSVRNSTIKTTKKEQESKFTSELDKFLEKCKDLDDEIEKNKETNDDDLLDENKKKISSLGKILDSFIEDATGRDLKNQRINLTILRCQAIISKLSHRVSNMKFEKQKKAFKKHKEVIDNSQVFIDDNVKNLQSNIITIVSLIFAAFTFIQLNFTAFPNSKDYSVWDRIILFGAINLFVIIGIYAVFSMIKSIIKSEEKSVCILLKSRLFIPIIFLVSIIVFAFYKNSNIDYKIKTDYYDQLISQKEKKLNQLNERSEALFISIKKAEKLLEDRNNQLIIFNDNLSKMKIELDGLLNKEKDEVLNREKIIMKDTIEESQKKLSKIN